MDKILLIADLSESVNELFDGLQKDYPTKIVSFDFSFLKKYLSTNKPELVIAYITDLSYQDDHNFHLMLEYAKNIPFIIIGPNRTCSDFLMTNASIKKFILTPVAVKDILVEIRKCIGNISNLTPATSPVRLPLSDAEPKKVLVVDDDPVMIRTMMNWLKDTYKVAVAKSGTEALMYLGKERPDLILLDYEMPVLNGVQTLEMIRKEESLKDIPVFFLTGVSNPEQVKAAIQLKPEGYLLKSSEKSTIIEKIDLFFAKINLGKGTLK